MKKTVVFASLATLGVIACGIPGFSIDDVTQEDGTLTVTTTPGEDLYYLTCAADLLKLSQMNDDGTAAPLTTDPDDVGDRYAGYWLDGSFVYPALDEGCDMIVCMPVPESISVGLMSYGNAGDTAPPDDLEAWLEENAPGMDAAETVADVQSNPISGTIKIELSYFSDAECEGASTTDSTTFTLQ